MTPEQEEQVRRALAAAADADQPMPPEVATRLDDVLAGLVAQQPPRHDEVAAARRRRRVGVLLTAAVVCLVALGGTALLRRSLDASGQASSSSAGGAAASQSGRRETGSTSGSGTAAALPPLHTGSLATDVERLLGPGGPAMPKEPFGARPQQRGAAPSGVPSTAPSTGRGPVASPTTACVRPPTRAGDRLVAVRLDGRPATLRLGPVTGGTRVARVYSCDGASTPLATARVPVP